MTGGVPATSTAPAVVSTTAEPEPVAAVQAPAQAAPVSVVNSGDTGDIEPKLIGVVVKHTGYPEDFIEMDQDLEGELGIDTVKQAEIMGDVEKSSLYL